MGFVENLSPACSATQNNPVAMGTPTPPHPLLLGMTTVALLPDELRASRDVEDDGAHDDGCYGDAEEDDGVLARVVQQKLRHDAVHGHEQPRRA